MRRITLKFSDCEFHLTLGAGLPRGGTIGSDLDRTPVPESIWSAAVDTLESFILAAACAGVDVESTEFREAIQTAVDHITNEYGDD